MERATLLYDADCGFCRWSASKILAWDRRGRLRAIPLRGAEADALLPGMNRERRFASWHLVTGDEIHSGGAAVAPLARLLPGAPIAVVAEFAPAITDRAYRWVARHRERLGRALGERTCAADPGSEAGAQPIDRLRG